MDHRLTTAIGHFPAHGLAIRNLASRDADFLDLCVDFADAHTAALTWASSAETDHDRFHAEYLQLADDLAGEIEAALDATKIIALSHQGRKHDPGM